MVVGWVVLGVVALIAVVVLFKSQDLIGTISLIRRNMFYIILIFVFLFLAFSLNHIHNTYDIDLSSFGGIVQAGKVYFLWFKSLIGNIGGVTGYAVQQNWWLDNLNATTGAG